MTRLNGRGVAPGVAVGHAVVVGQEASMVRYRLAANGVDRERQRFRTARDHTRRDLEEISARMARTLGAAQASIFAAQLMMLDDPLLWRRTDDLIRTQRINVEWALERAVGELHEALAREGDAWVRERVGDVFDVSGRIRRNLRPGNDSLAQRIQEVEPPVILFVDELAPSAAAQLDWTRVRGLVCDAGSPTSHTVILARSVGVPAIVGLGGEAQGVTPGTTVAIDGASGEVIIDPSAEIIAGWQHRATVAVATQHALDQLRDRPALTRDGVRIRLEANLEIADDVERVREAGAEGIGLYRSEFLLAPSRPDPLDEEAQVRVYRGLLSAMAPLPVTVRTFDAAEEALTGGRVGHRERFGARGVRTALQNDERFRVQIRALLRAADAGTLRILLPFVTTGEEMRRVRSLIAQVGEGLPKADVPLGAMIEVPAAALTVDSLAQHSDFLSVGTNDLIQYTLAVDRTDERLASHYEPASPAVLRLLRTIAAQARRTKTPLSVCGEMAADPVMASLLVGLGFRAFSLTPSAIPQVKQALATVDVRQATVLARRALLARSADEVRQILTALADALPQAALAHL